ncbi:unnamed protein product [Calicophoron daubneyi]|uniref:Magnesium transporter NIPA2 n=1 Tax=Calicophoron daubneyi TaxID=300641 RepID=A0AAV2TLH5_CALDB
MVNWKDELSTPFSAGFILALLSTFVIGIGFIFKKKALLRASAHGIRAGDGGLVYLRDWMWWVGLSCLALGEGANFIAYALAPAALVTPLGGLSVLVSAVLSARYLDERLNLAGKLGCLICLLGSTMVVLHAPKEQVVSSLHDIQEKFFDRAFLIYIGVVLLTATVLIFLIGPRFGKTNPLVYLGISAILGSISVVACKGMGIGLKEAIKNGFLSLLSSWFFWLLIFLLVAGLALQLYFLNRALDLFNTGLVTALLYVFFTAFVLTATAILYREWSGLNPIDYTELTFALIFISVGIFMMTVLKDAHFEWKGITKVGSGTHSPAYRAHHRARSDQSPPTYESLSTGMHHQRNKLKSKRSPSVRRVDLRALLSSSPSDLSEGEADSLPEYVNTGGQLPKGKRTGGNERCSPRTYTTVESEYAVAPEIVKSMGSSLHKF